jgi:hypothetical protein
MIPEVLAGSIMVSATAFVIAATNIFSKVFAVFINIADKAGFTAAFRTDEA